MKKIKLEDSAFVTSGKAYILALIVFCILSLLFSGCANKSYTNEPYIVGKIISATINGQELCWYQNKNEDWKILDVCNKFHVGDSIQLNTVKYSK